MPGGRAGLPRPSSFRQWNDHFVDDMEGVEGAAVLPHQAYESPSATS